MYSATWKYQIDIPKFMKIRFGAKSWNFDIFGYFSKMRDGRIMIFGKVIPYDMN